jgi:hypothetical protein
MRILSYSQYVTEKIAHVNLDDFADDVAAAYKAAPEIELGVEKYWDALNQSNHKLFDHIKSKYKVEFVDEDPYVSAEEMRREADDTGILKIYKGESNHPYFSDKDNWIFRAVHDYYTHIATHTENFDLRGEVRAYNTHMKLVPPMARPALFTELIGQVCFAIKYGNFPKQKMALLPGFDYEVVGQYNKVNQ